MKKALVWLAAGLALAIGFGALAVTTGGFPSRPRFQDVQIGSPSAKASWGSFNVLTGPSASLGFYDGVYGDIRLDTNAYYTGSSWACLTSNPTAQELDVQAGWGGAPGWWVYNGCTAAGQTFTPTQGYLCTSSGTGCPWHASGKLVGAGNAGSGCNILMTDNVARCTRTGTGTYTVAFTTNPDSGDYPICTVSAGPGGATGTSPLVAWQAGTAAPASFSFIEAGTTSIAYEDPVYFTIVCREAPT